MAPQWRPSRPLLGAIWALTAASLAEGGVTIRTPPSADTVILKLDPRVAQRTAPASSSEANRDLLVRADRLQYLHRFAEAEHLLDQWLRASPWDENVLLQRAQLRIAQRKPQAAMADCLRAAARLSALAASGCEAQVLLSLGEISRGRRLIEAVLRTDTASVGTIENLAERSWAAGIAAELAERARDWDAAERWHRLAMATAGNSHYPRIAYAQFLLAQRQPQRVVTLLAAVPDDPSVMSLRRRAIAELRP